MMGTMEDGGGDGGDDGEDTGVVANVEGIAGDSSGADTR